MKLVAKIIPKKEMIDELHAKYPAFKEYYFEAIQGLFSLSNELERYMDQFFSACCEKFSRPRFLILLILVHSDDQRLLPNEIAKKLNVTRGNMTGLIDGLEADGYVTKTPDEADRRQVWIQITPSGKKLLDRILPDYFKRIDHFMSALKRDEILQLTKLAAKLEQTIPNAITQVMDKKSDKT